MQERDTIKAFLEDFNMTEDVEFTIKAKMNLRWVNHFMSMLKMMEHCGNVGQSMSVSIFADGDGDFRPTFTTDVKFTKVKPRHEYMGCVEYDAG